MAQKKKKEPTNERISGNLITQDRSGNVVRKQLKPAVSDAEYNYKNNIQKTTEKLQVGKNKYKTVTSTVSKNVLRNQNKDGYLDTKKTYGDYSKSDSSKRNYKVYQKDNKFYYYDEKNKKYEKMTGKNEKTQYVFDKNKTNDNNKLLTSSDKNNLLSSNNKPQFGKEKKTYSTVDYSNQIKKDMAKDDAEQEKKWLKSLSKEDKKAYEESAKYTNKVQKAKEKKATQEYINKREKLQFEANKEGLNKFQNQEQMPSLLEVANYIKENQAKENQYSEENPVSVKGPHNSIASSDLNPTSRYYKRGEIGVELQPERLNLAKETNELARTQFEENQWVERNKETTGLEKLTQPITNAGASLIQGLDTPFDFGNRLYFDEQGTPQYLQSKSDLQWQRTLDSYNTKVGKFLAETTNNVGKILATEAMNVVIPGSGTAVYWASMFGNNYQNAFNQSGGDTTKASLNAIANTGIEFLTAKTLGSATKGLTGGKASELETALSNLTYKISKNPVLSSYLGKGGSEFTEEFIQEYLGNAVDILTLGSDGTHDSLKEMLSDPDVLTAALYSGLMGAVSSFGTAATTNAGTRISGGITEAQSIEMTKTFKEDLESAIEEYKKNPEENKKKIKKLEKVLKEVEKSSKTPFTDNTVQSNLDTMNNINNKINSTYSEEQKAQMQEIQQNVANGTIDHEQANQYIRQVQNGTYQNNRNLEQIADSQRNELQQRLESGEITQQEFNQEIQALNNTLVSERNRINEDLESAKQPTLSLEESAIRNNLDPNSPTVQAVQNMMEKRGINATFDADRFDDTNTNAFWSIDEDGNRQVVFNPNATTNDIVEEIAIHELTHDLMSSENSKGALKGEKILSFVKSMKGYEEARNRIEQTYSDVYDINDPKYEQLINEEVIADVLGRKLGNQEFINQLVNKKQNIAKRIYDFVVDKLNSLVNNGKVRNERLYWGTIKNNFEKAYSMEYNNNEKADTKFTKFATRENNPYGHIKDFVNLSEETQADAHKVISPLAAELNSKGKQFGTTTDVNGNTYDFEVFGDSTYRVTNVEKLKDSIKEVASERNPNKNSRYSVGDTRNIGDNSSIYNESDRNRRTSKENVELSSKEQIKQENNGYRLSDTKQEKNNKGLDNSSFTMDNQGRKLTKEQQSYFKDVSKEVKDENGNLKTFYRGDPQEINIFDKNHKAKRYTNFGAEYESDIKGFFFTENPDYASNFGNVKEYYLKITKPLNMETNKNDLNKIFKPMLDDMLENQDIYKWQYDTAVENGTIYRRFIDENGVDWETIDNDAFNKSINIMRELGYDSLEVNEGDGEKSFFVFDSNQIKNVDNKNPTTNDDVRKSQSNDEWKRFLDKNIKRSGTGRTINDIRTGPNRLSQVETTGEQGAKYWQSEGANKQIAKILSEDDLKETKPLIQKIKENKATVGEEIKVFKRKFIDKGETIRKIAKATKNRLLDAKYDKMGTAVAEAQYDIGKTQTNLKGKKFKNFTDENGKKVSMSLNQIWEGIDSKIANEYLAHWLNVDRYGQVNTKGKKLQEDLEKQVKKGKITQEEANEIWNNSGELYKYVFGPDVTAEDSQKRIEELEKEHPELKRFGENIWQYGKNQLQNRVDAGVISKAEQEAFLRDTPHYVRLQRNVPKKSDTTVKTDLKGNAEVNKQIQSFEGSTLDIIPFKTSMADYTMKTTQEIRANEFAKELAKTIGVSSTYSEVKSIDEMFGVDPELIKDNGDGTYSLTFFNNGVATTIPINEGIYEALTPNKHFDWEDKMIFKGIRKMDSWRKALLTDKNPMFMATNMLKDFFDAPLNSKYPLLFAKNYPRALKEMVTNGEYFQQYQALGGLQNSFFSNEKGFEKQGSKYSPITWIEKGNNIIEQLPRLAEFMSTLEKTGNVEEAMYNAAEITTNFKRGGDYTKALNRNGATFLNASIQGFDKQIRNFTEVQNPTQAVQLLAKVVILGIAPALFNDIVYDDDDEYKELQDYQKDRYYLIKGKDGNWVRIPKGRAVSIFQSATRRTKNLIEGDKKAFKGFGELALNQVGPSNPLESNIASPLLNVATNKSWSGNPIVSEYEKNTKKPKDQYDAKTDEVSKYLGKKLNVSPKKINYLLDQYTGAIGDFVLPNITKYKTHEVNGPIDVIANPFRDKFTTNIANSNKSQNDFYETLGKAQKESSKKGKLQTKYLDSKSSEMAEIRKEIKDVQSSNVSDKEKIKKTREYQNEINKIARDAVNESKKVKIEKNTANVGNTLYYKNSKGDWSKESDKTKERREDLGLSAKEYYHLKNDESYTQPNGYKKYITSGENAKRNMAIVDAFNFDTSDYLEYTYKISKIQGNKNSKGKTIKGTRQPKVIEYINSLPISSTQKAYLYKTQYSSYRSQDRTLANEINKSNLSKEEKEQIYSYLGLGR